MWKLWHKLFGWDYVIVYSRDYRASKVLEIRRLHTAKDGTEFTYDLLDRPDLLSETTLIARLT